MSPCSSYSSLTLSNFPLNRWYNLASPPKERAFTIAEVQSANEAFISSAATLILPVIEINKHIIGSGNIGPITKILRDTYIKISKHNSI